MLRHVPPLLPTLRDNATIRRVRDNNRRELYVLPITPLRRVPTRERRNAALTGVRKRTDAPRPVPGLPPIRRRDSELPRQRTPLIITSRRVTSRRVRRFHPARRRDSSPISSSNRLTVPIRRGMAVPIRRRRDSGGRKRFTAMTITARRRVPTGARRAATTSAVRRRNRNGTPTPRPVRFPAYPANRRAIPNSRDSGARRIRIARKGDATPPFPTPPRGIPTPRRAKIRNGERIPFRRVADITTRNGVLPNGKTPLRNRRDAMAVKRRPAA